MTFVLVAGTTRTARIDGISAAGATPELMEHTPAADAEIVEYGRLVRSPIVPVSPSGCPTPAVLARAVRELVGFESTVVDAGLAAPTGAATVDLRASPGDDLRAEAAVPAAAAVVERARSLGRALSDDRVVVAETIPGGTTTAMGVLAALGERTGVSSSLPENPVALKRDVVNEGLELSGLSPGDASGEPLAALRRVGDPVLAAVAGIAREAAETDAEVVLAGGTQMLAAAALLRHDGVEAPLSIATTSFVEDDETAALREGAADLDVDVTATDPGFDRSDRPAMRAFVRGEAKEGVGMGGALALAAEANVDASAVRERAAAVYERLAGGDPAPERSAATTGRGCDAR